jgi:AcrR family transcriptional regulator
MAHTKSRGKAAERRDQIMRAATELFARQGFRGTTTRQIAATARVNEAIIFRHFPHKEDLYWAVIEHKCLAGKGADADCGLENLTGSGRSSLQIHETFAAIAEQMLRRQAEDITLTRLLLFSALESHSLSHRFFRTYMAVFYDRLAQYIRGCIRDGVFRAVDPYLAARGFLGMVIYHFWVQELFGGARQRKFNPKQVSATLTDIWLKGILTGNGRGRRTFQRASSVRRSNPHREPAIDHISLREGRTKAGRQSTAVP